MSVQEVAGALELACDTEESRCELQFQEMSCTLVLRSLHLSLCLIGRGLMVLVSTMVLTSGTSEISCETLSRTLGITSCFQNVLWPDQAHD